MNSLAVTEPRSSRFALACVYTIAAWILAGAAFKFFEGTPALLPEIVRRVPLEIGLTYKLAIGIELAIVAVALTKPRWGWGLQAALLFVFDAVLTTQIAAGEKNCGCFGAGFSVEPKLMMAIDSVMLVALLAAQPWRNLAPGPSPATPLAVGLIALALPWLHDRQLKPGEVHSDGEPVEGQYMDLQVAKWVGQDVFQTPLAQPPLNEYLDVNALPLDGLWVFWRQTCEHCKVHLEHLAATETGERMIGLIQLEEPGDTLANRIVHVMPAGNFVQHASLPPNISYLMQTPAELLLEGAKIVAAAEGVTPQGETAQPERDGAR